jgi:hypothetical protein
MGSPVSFPILCIVNAAVTRYSLERSFDKTILLTDGAFLVNGDDVIFTIPSGCYQNWVKDVTSAGLSPSVGKNFVSRRYGVINSQVYDCGEHWDLPGCNLKVSKIPLVKMNLVMCGQHTTTERRKGENLFIGEALRHGKTLEGRLWEMIDGFQGDERELLLSRAYHYAFPLLKKLPSVSWVLPKSLGGLGLPPKKDHVISDLHLKIASMITCLDDETRHEVVRLNWLREPGKIFCEETNEQIREINEDLGNKLVLRPGKPDDIIYSKLIKSNLGLGLDDSVIDPKKVLVQWFRTYDKWVKRAKAIKWTTSKDHNQKGLHAMNPERALSYTDHYWCWDNEIQWK